MGGLVTLGLQSSMKSPSSTRVSGDSWLSLRRSSLIGSDLIPFATCCMAVHCGSLGKITREGGSGCETKFFRGQIWANSTSRKERRQSAVSPSRSDTIEPLGVVSAAGIVPSNRDMGACK